MPQVSDDWGTSLIGLEGWLIGAPTQGSRKKVAQENAPGTDDRVSSKLTVNPAKSAKTPEARRAGPGRDNPKTASLVNIRIMSATRKRKNQERRSPLGRPEDVREGRPQIFRLLPKSVAPTEPGSRVKGASTPLRALDPFPEIRAGTESGSRFCIFVKVRQDELYPRGVADEPRPLRAQRSDQPNRLEHRGVVWPTTRTPVSENGF